jgi:hypothetical protein
MNAQSPGPYLLLVTAAFFTGCGTNRFQQELQTEEAAVKLANETVEGGYQLVTTAELKKMLDGGEDFLLVDAMPAEDSYDKGHISRAVNFPFPKELMDGWNDNEYGPTFRLRWTNSHRLPARSLTAAIARRKRWRSPGSDR